VSAILAHAVTSTGHLSIIKIFALTFSSDMINNSMGCILAPAVSNFSSRQNDRVGIVAYAEAASSIDGCPLIFALAFAKWIKISIRIGAEADAVGAHLGVSGILAPANTSTGHLSIV
jgi:hypothetical protein